MVYYLFLILSLCTMETFSQETNKYNFSQEIDTLLQRLQEEVSQEEIPAKKVAIVTVNYSKNISVATQEYFLTKLSQLNVGQMQYKFFVCMECIQPRIRINPESPQNKDLIIEKGLTSVEDFSRIQETFKVDTIAHINLSYDSQDLLLSISIYDIKTKIQSLWSKTLRHYVKKENELISEMDFYFKEGFLLTQSFTNVVQLGIGENVYNKRSVGLNIEMALASLKIKNYFGIGPYFTFLLNQSRIQYKINLGVNYGAINSVANVILPLDLIIQLFPHVHYFLGVKTSFKILNKKNSENLISQLPFSAIFGFGVNF